MKIRWGNFNITRNHYDIRSMVVYHIQMAHHVEGYDFITLYSDHHSKLSDIIYLRHDPRLSLGL